MLTTHTRLRAVWPPAYQPRRSQMKKDAKTKSVHVLLRSISVLTLRAQAVAAWQERSRHCPKPHAQRWPKKGSATRGSPFTAASVVDAYVVEVDPDIEACE